MRREVCGGCASPDLETFLDLGSTPLADRFPAGADQPEQWYPLQLAVCPQCWLVQQLEVVDDADLFGADYAFHSSASPSLVAYQERYAQWALAAFGQRARRLTVEIACNDGGLLRHFADAGCPVLGVDPAAGPAQLAAARGLPVVVRRFDRDCAEAIRADHGPAGLVVANNVLAHAADLGGFLDGLWHLLDDDGVLLVEVQDFADLLLGNGVDHVYHEHRFHFTVVTLENVMIRHGLEISAIQLTPAQGGSIRVMAHRCDPISGVNSTLVGFDCLDVYRAVQPRADLLRGRLLDLLAAQHDAGRTVAGYAASAKSTTLLNWCRIGPNLVSHIVDTTPAKIGRVTPGSHIPIVAPGDRPEPDVYLLLAHNYLPDLLRRERAYLDAGGRFLVPVPVPVLL